MTQMLHGNRELMVASTGGARLLVLSDGEIPEGEFTGLWHRRKLKPEPLAILNPPTKPPKDFKPVAGHFLLFDQEHKSYKDGLTKEWSAWARSNKVHVTTLREVRPELVYQSLVAGVFDVTFTEEAAEWYTRVIGTSLLRQQREIDKFQMCGINQVDLETATHVIGGVEETKAERILKALGTARACQLVLEVTPNNAYRLFTYLEIPLRNRKSPWLIALLALRRAMEIKTLESQSALQLFVQYCYRAKHTGDDLTPMTDILRIARLDTSRGQY